MKIEKVETWLVERWLTVRVTCDDGTHGVGEGTFWSYADAAEAIARAIGDDLIGQDPLRAEHIWNSAYRKFSFRSEAITAAISAIDIALWDIKGKHYDAPVWDLLGGRVRDRVRAMALSAGGAGPNEFAANARARNQAGYTALKMTPFPSGWAGLPYSALIRGNTEIVAAVREEVGWDFDIGVEIHRNMVPSEAIVFAAQIEKYLPYFYEDPIAPDSVYSMGDVADRINLPLAVGERNNTIWEFREYSALPNVAFVRPDVGLAGGITHVRKIAAIAESYHQRVIPHNFLGPITTMACVHLAAATPNWDLQEYQPDQEAIYQHIVTPQLEIRDEYFTIPDAPGLGIDIVEENLPNFPFTRGAGDQSRRPDGSVALR